MSLLKAIREECPTDKVVLVSNYTESLALCNKARRAVAPTGRIGCPSTAAAQPVLRELMPFLHACGLAGVQGQPLGHAEPDGRPGCAQAPGASQRAWHSLTGVAMPQAPRQSL